MARLRAIGSGVGPGELTLWDLHVVCLFGWKAPARGEKRRLKSEADYHSFLRTWGSDPSLWERGPGVYDVGDELRKIEARRSDPVRWLSTPGGMVWGSYCRPLNTFWVHTGLGVSWARRFFAGDYSAMTRASA
jgi:hypothetical protein